MNNSPLVSVVVITYNSEKTIIETLDSISTQTYQNIELIVSDDGSKDNTCRAVQDWLVLNNGRFVNSELLTVETNQGTVKNLNRGVFASSGEWIKSIAGDDCLIDTSIEEYVKYVNMHQDCKMCISQTELFSSDGRISIETEQAYVNFFEESNVDLKKQKSKILQKLTFVGPTYFYSRSLFDEIGGFNEDYKLSEEWPFCFSVLQKGYRIHAVPQKLVRYRVSSSSLTHNTRSVSVGNYTLFKEERKFFFKSRLPLLLKKGSYLDAYSFILYFFTYGIVYRYQRYYPINHLIKITNIINPIYIVNASKRFYRTFATKKHIRI